jgi:hypothetical protein
VEQSRALILGPENLILVATRGLPTLVLGTGQMEGSCQ